MNWHFEDEALAEYEEAITYHGNISKLTGLGFIADFEATMARILSHPEANLSGRRGTRRRHLKNHSYIIVFRPSTIQTHSLAVVAVAHDRRGDEYWDAVFARF